MKDKWIDISVCLHSGMVHWPRDPSVRFQQVRRMDRGDPCNVSKFSMGSHTGTHMDAPLHFLARGKGLDRMPLDATIGRARVIEIRDRESIKAKELRKHKIRAGERILFKTLNSRRCWKQKGFVKDFVYISEEAACELAARRVRTVGIDYLSVGSYFYGGAEIHRALLSRGVWIIEGLDLSRAKPGNYHLICLPLRVFRSDGAPARAVLLPVR